MKVSSRLFMCRHRRKSGSNRVCGGRGKGLQPRVSREAQLAVLLRRRFLHLASLLGCQTGATSLQELHGGTPSPAVHQRSQRRAGASAALPPISLPPVCSGLGTGSAQGPVCRGGGCESSWKGRDAPSVRSKQCGSVCEGARGKTRGNWSNCHSNKGSSLGCFLHRLKLGDGK